MELVKTDKELKELQNLIQCYLINHIRSVKQQEDFLEILDSLNVFKK